MSKIIKDSFTHSKVASHNVKKGNEGNLGLPPHGTNLHKTNVPFKSGSKASRNPTSR